MRKRLLSLFAVLALALVPAFGAATEAPAGEPTTPVVLVKAYATVASVTTDDAGTKVELDVEEAHEWVDGTDTKTLAIGINGQRISASSTPKSVVAKGDTPVELAELTAGMKVKALLETNGTPVSTTCTYFVNHISIQVPSESKPNPGHKFESGFFPRLWHMRGPILGLERIEDRNVMNLDVRRLENAPKRFRDEGSRLARLDAYVIVPDKVVITDEDGDRITFAELSVDDRVKVVGKFLKPDKWVVDESGEPTPTLIAKRIKVKDRA